MKWRPASLGAVVALALIVASGCSSGQPGALTVAAQRQLVAKVQQVRDVAATGTYAELSREVRQLRTLVERLNQQGQVTDARMAAIEDAADTLLNDAKPKPSASPSTSSSSASPSPSPTKSSPSPSPSPSQSSSSSSSESPTPTTTISVP